MNCTQRFAVTVAVFSIGMGPFMALAQDEPAAKGFAAGIAAYLFVMLLLRLCLWVIEPDRDVFAELFGVSR